MSYTDEQHYLGLAGLAFLRGWLTEKRQFTSQILISIYRFLKTHPKSRFNDKLQQPKRFNISEGYKKWAKTYDNPNLLIQIEEPEVKSILRKFPKGKVLDAGCGTGRYSIFLAELGHAVTGIDQSKEMLEMATIKNRNITLILGNIERLPFDKNNFDLVLCSLTLTHFRKLKSSMSELSRVLRRDGYLVISDINPWFVALGGHADFHDNSGRWGYIRNFIHWHSEYLNLFRNYNLEVEDCREPVIKPKHFKTTDEMNNRTVDKNISLLALNGLPIALIWVLRKTK